MSPAFAPVWGARRDGDSAVFRIWAPAVDRLRLRTEGHSERDMDRLDDGWFELRAQGVPENAAYSFVLPDGKAVPDPASRAQVSDVHGPSLLADDRFDWKTKDWQGRTWEEAIIYELHPGTFSQSGDFDGIRRKLDHLAGLGVTAVELMPVAQFSGERGWGYDGVLPYCPHRAYGGVAGLKRLVDAAHERGLMMILDVVYNHFGPDGNYLGTYAPEFFDPSRQTPWGPAIRFEKPAVRDFFLDNPIYWLEEFRFDGLRFDAIDQILDESLMHILEEMASRVRAQFSGRRPVHLMTEDERNIILLHPRDDNNRPILFTAEWNDDFHHAAHCVATGEDGSYYEAFADDPVTHLARALAEGFCYQGEPYAPRGGKPRGVASAGQPPTAFVAFLQNHDQIGNRAFGERLTELADEETIELLTAVLLLGTQIPLLFMGEEYGETRPFLFFTDFHGDLANAVREGRRHEFAEFSHFDTEDVPDPNALSTFEASRLDWDRCDSEAGRMHLALVQQLLEIRRTHIVPRLPRFQAMQGEWERAGDQGFCVRWSLDGEDLVMAANFAAADADLSGAIEAASLAYESRSGLADRIAEGVLPARSVSVLFAVRQVDEG